MSNADLLHANAADLETAGREFLACGDTTQDTMNRMRNQVNMLTASFAGSAAAAFYNKMDMMFTEIQRVCEEMTEMGNDLNATASRVRQLQAEAENLLRD